MKYLIQTVLALAVLALATTVLADKPMDVSLKYSGYGHDTTVEMFEDGLPVNLTQAMGKGTFGKSMLAITVEFVIDESVVCPAGYDIPIGVLDVPDHMWATVITAANHDQVYGMFDTGWLCMTADHLHWVGGTNGIFVGGTGRYENASGEWEATFSGTNLDPSIGLRSIAGEMIGTLYLD